MNRDAIKERLDGVLEQPFDGLEGCLAHYREVLPGRVGDYHLEEVGPIMPHDEPGEADRFVQREFRLGEVTVDLTAGLDWYAAPGGDLEWNGGLVRHGYMTLLAKAYRETGKEVYAATLVEHLLDYIERVPPIDPEGMPYLDYKRSTWRPFEVACRAGETWPEALAGIIGSPSMTPEAWGKILYSIHQHAEFLKRHHWPNGNHATLEVADLGIIAVFFPEFRESAGWFAYALDFLDRMWPELFEEDGYTRELSGSYHWVAMRSYLSFFEVARVNGLGNRFPERYRERLIRNSLAELYQVKPDGSTPVSNDSSMRINRREQLERMDRLLGIPGIRYFLSGGREGVPPEPSSYFYPRSRIGIQRSDWSPKARYLYFDMGPWGDNHMNQDQLSVEVFAFGRPLLVNGGKWRYTTSDPEADWMPLARYFKSTAACNGVLVNGYNQVFGDAEGTMATGPDFDYADGCFRAGFGEEVPGRDEQLFREKGLATRMEKRVPGAVHRRQVAFVRPHFWILRDTVEGPGVAFAEQVWHFTGGGLRSRSHVGQCWHTVFSDANLVLISTGAAPLTARTCTGQKEPFFAGWHCPYYDVLRPAPELRIHQAATGKLVFHTLLFPLEGKVGEVPGFRYETGIYQIEREGQSWRVAAPEEGAWQLA